MTGKWPFTKKDDRLFKGYRAKKDQIASIHAELERRWDMEIPRYVVAHRASQLGLSSWKKKRFPNDGRDWTEEHLEWLSTFYGLKSDQELCDHLGRTFNSIILATKRLLHINRKMQFYTASEVARELGLSCCKIAADWTRKGYMKGRRSSVRCGRLRTWLFTYEDIEKALHKRPWLARRDRMSESGSYFRIVVDEERERDPWFTADEAAPQFGISGGYRVARYIRKKWLKGEFFRGTKSNGMWVIRQSWINRMLAHDPRPEHFRANLIRSQRRRILNTGKAARFACAWLLPCPNCSELVTVLAPMNWMGPAIKRNFKKQFLNGSCNHHGLVVLEEIVDLELLGR